MSRTPTSSDVDPRQHLVATTIELLGEEGPEALQVRRIAAAAGVSSMVVYSRFGGMPQLVAAVIAEGVNRVSDLYSQFESTSDPVADMCRLGLAYYGFASDNPHLFDLMFGLSTPGGYRQIERPKRSPGEDGKSSLDDALRPLISHSKRAMTLKRVRRQDPEKMAAEIWGSVHGFTSLELSGYYSHFDDPVKEVFMPLMSHIAVGLGDDPRRAARSIRKALAACAAT